MLYNNGRLADVNTMSYDDLVIIKLTSEMPLELRQKIFTLELGVDQMTWEKFVLALTNIVAIEKVTKVKRLAPIGNISAKSGGKKKYPDATSLPDLCPQARLYEVWSGAHYCRLYCSKDSHLFTLSQTGSPSTGVLLKNPI